MQTQISAPPNESAKTFMFNNVFSREKHLARLRPFYESDVIIRDKKQSYAYIQVAYTLYGEDDKATEKIKERE